MNNGVPNGESSHLERQMPQQRRRPRQNPQQNPIPDEEMFERMNARYEQEKQYHLSHGAECDPNNGSIIRKAKRSLKIQAQGRKGNIALDIDRPVLPTMTFQELKDNLLSKKFEPKTENKPEFHFLDIETNIAAD